MGVNSNEFFRCGQRTSSSVSKTKIVCRWWKSCCVSETKWFIYRRLGILKPQNFECCEHRFHPFLICWNWSSKQSINLLLLNECLYNSKRFLDNIVKQEKLGKSIYTKCLFIFAISTVQCPQIPNNCGDCFYERRFQDTFLEVRR